MAVSLCHRGLHDEDDRKWREMRRDCTSKRGKSAANVNAYIDNPIKNNTTFVNFWQEFQKNYKKILM